MRVIRLLLCFSLFFLIVFAACSSEQDVTADDPNRLNLRPGVYSGEGSGFKGDIIVEVEIDGDGQIARIDVVRHEDTPGFAYPSFEIMRSEILRLQSTDVALITGASASPRGFRTAVEDALVQAGADLSQLRPGATPPVVSQVVQDAAGPPREDYEFIAFIDNTLSEAALAALPVSTAVFTPGVYTAIAPGWQDAPMTVQVSFSENQISGIEILEHGESIYGSGWAFRALPGVPDQILVRQSTQDIDLFSGATVTRNAVINAVEYAIMQAGADPSDLTPQLISAPLPGDRFIPGFIEITVPANTMDIYGNPLTEGATRMLFNEEVDMNLRLSFGRNEFHLHSGGAFGLGQGGEGHGESVYEPGQIGGGTWGGWWFRQVANHQVNDRQSTLGIDTATGATMSASAIVWGVEQAMAAQGADPADILPVMYPRTQIQRNPSGEPEDPFFVPGVYTVTVPGWGGPMTFRITLDRTNIRRIEVIEHSETESFWNIVWGADANHVMRDSIFEAGSANLDEVDLVVGATVSASAIVEAVRAAMELAWVD